MNAVGSAGQQPAKWTILYYYDGKNNLASMAKHAFNSLDEVGSNEDVNLVAQIGLPKEKVYQGLVRKGLGTAGFQSIGRADMGSADNVKQFVEWGMKNYPAEHYALVMWDHGAGFKGSMTDDDTHHIIKNADLARALEDAQKSTGNKLEVINFNACLMQQAEVAYELKNSANYLVGSEEVEAGLRIPIPGVFGTAPQHTVAKDIQEAVKTRGDLNGEELARLFVYEAKNQFGSGLFTPTQSAIDLSKMDSVKTAADNLASLLTDKVKANPDLVEALRKDIRNTQHYLAADMYVEPYNDYRDLGDFSRVILKDEKFSSDPAIKNAALDVQAAVREAVIAEHHAPQSGMGSRSLEGSTGMATYLPADYGFDKPGKNSIDGVKSGGNHGYDETTYAKSSKWEDMLKTVARDDDWKGKFPKLQRNARGKPLALAVRPSSQNRNMRYRMIARIPANPFRPSTAGRAGSRDRRQSPTVALALAMALLLSLVASAPPADAAKPRQAYDGPGAVSRVASLVENEFLEPVQEARLVGGALKGLREYLQHGRLRLAGIPQAGASMAVFRKAWKDAVAANPRADQKQMAFAAVRGMLDKLGDPYTVFLDPEEYKSLMGQLNGGNFGGLGIYIELDDKNEKALTVVEPMEGTPAMKAGLKPRDVILEIGGKSTKGMPLEEATRLLRGPVGSTVILKIQRPGTPDALDIPVTRAIIHVKTLSYKIVDGNVGYVKLRVFGENVNEEMEEAFRSFDRAGVKAYILDLRNNGGGYITAALDVSSKFLPTGSRVVSVAERGAPEIVYNSRPNMRDRLPFVVLVNKYSASASEITAGAMKDLKSAVLMGEKTFGKGSVQKIFPLPDGSAVKVTTAHYRTPNGSDIHKKGIQPDVAIQMKLEDVGGDNDLQLKAALDLLKGKIAQNETRLASNAGGDVVAGDGIIRVGSSAEEFDYVDKLRCSDGGRYTIESQRMVNEGGVMLDEVTIKCDRAGERKTLRFQLEFFAK